jgi:hypothetical protein
VILTYSLRPAADGMIGVEEAFRAVSGMRAIMPGVAGERLNT